MSKAMAYLLYAQRDVCELEPYYCLHVDHMTGEELHSKSDIAAELAYRDQKIEALESQRDALLEALDGLMALESRGRIMPIGTEWDKARAAIKSVEE